MNEQIKKRISAINSGIVPKGWKSVRLDDIAEVFDGIHQTPDYKSHGIKFVSVENINGLYSSDKYISEEEYIKSYKIKPEINDILMTRIGDIGTPAIVDSDEPLAFYVSLALIKCNSKINSKYFYCFISSEFFQKELWKKTLHIAFPKKINKGDIGKCKLLLPSIEEQQKIAEILSTQDKLIELQERKIEQLKTLKKGAKSPELRFKGFTEPWEKRKLGEVVKSIDTGKSKFHSDSTNGAYAILGSTSIIGYDDCYDYDGDFILTARVGANAGSLYRYTGKAKISDNTVFIQAERNIEFVYYMLTKFDIKQLSFGTGQPLVKASELKNLDLKIPNNIEEQHKTGDFFRNIDNLITLHQHKLDKEKQKKKALMQLLLTGKVRVIT